METLVKCHQVQAVYVAYLIVHDLKLAEDVVQTSFLHAAEKISQFDETRPFKAWFLKSVIHAAIKAAKQQERLISLDEDNDDETSTVIHWLSDPDQDPEEIVETEETRQLIWEALQRIPAEQRAVIIMRYFLEMDEQEMIRKLNRPATTIRWWLRTARKQLKEFILPSWKIEHPELKKDEKEE